MSHASRPSGRVDNRPELIELHQQGQVALNASEEGLNELGSARERMHNLLTLMEAFGQEDQQVLPL